MPCPRLGTDFPWSELDTVGDALRSTLSHLDDPRNLAAAAVCRSWRAAALDDSLWRALCKVRASEFPLLGVL